MAVLALTITLAGPLVLLALALTVALALISRSPAARRLGRIAHDARHAGSAVLALVLALGAVGDQVVDFLGGLVGVGGVGGDAIRRDAAVGILQQQVHHMVCGQVPLALVARAAAKMV